MPKSLLVIAAWAPELERFREVVAATFSEAPSLEIGGVGIGLVDAAIGTTQRLIEAEPGCVLLLGTCGAAPGSGLAIGDVVVATAVHLADGAALEGHAALPWMPAPITVAEALREPFVAQGARPASVVTTLGITTADGLARTIAAAGETEHLEAYAVARACERLGVPCVIVLGVANVVGAAGRAEWRANHVAVSARVAEVAARGIGALAVAVRRSTTARSPG